MNCLVIVDMQKGFMNEETEHLREKLADFLSEKSSFFDHVVATQYINHEGTACSVFEGWTDCMEDSEEAELIDEVCSAELDVIIAKDKYSCYGNVFKHYIKQNGIDKVYYVGVNTGCCVLHSAFDTYNDLIDSYVIEDLCGSTSGKYSHDCAIQVLKECITEQRVITSDTIG